MRLRSDIKKALHLKSMSQGTASSEGDARKHSQVASESSFKLERTTSNELSKPGNEMDEFLSTVKGSNS